MGAQSIKIPVELELRQLQGSIETLKKALDKIDPGSKVYDKLSKALDKVEQKYNSLENASKRTFKSTTEINKFEQSFEKVANSIDDLASDFKRIKFEDLTSDIFSQDDVDRIQKASTKIKNVQNEISSLKVEKLKELANSSIEIQQIFDDLKIDPDVSGFEDSLNKIKKNVTELKRSITSLEKKRDTKQQKETELDTKITGISDLSTKGNLAQKFGAQFFDKSGTKYKAGGKQLLTEYLAQLGLKPTDIAKVQNATASELEKFANEIIKKLQSTVPQLKKEKADVQKEISDITGQINTKTTDLNQKTNAVSSIEGINPVIKAELETLQLKLQEAQAEMVKLKNELAQLRGPAGEAGNAIKGVGDASEEAKEKFEDAGASAQKFAAAQEKLADIKFAIKNWFGFNEVINLTKNAVRNMITQIRELDDVMTQIAIVTDMTQQELWDQMDTYSAMAQQYGASIKGVYEVSQLYYQQGLQTAEVMNLTEETLKMAKIANLDYAEATDYMTVALRGFKLEMSNAQQVTDVYSALAAATASDTEELAVAMSKTASSAEAVGSSFESTSAMIATMISITREAPENIGSALKSIISRYGEMTSDPMKLVDSEGEEMSLNKVDKALQSVGISLQDAQGQFRDFDDVILELSKSWDTIDTNTQRYIATVMAGNRQQSRFLALVGNYEEYAKALEVAENAEDAGTLQTLKTMDSISTKWEQLKVSLQEFYTSAGLEDVFKGVLDALNAFLTKANDIPKLFGKIPVSVIALVSSLITSIKNVATSLTTSLMGPISEFNEKLKELKNKGPIEIKVKAVAETGSGTQARQILENEVQQGGPIVAGQPAALDANKKQALQNYFDTLDEGEEAGLNELRQAYNLSANEALKFSNALDKLTPSQREALLSGKSLDEVLGELPKTLTENTSKVSAFSKGWKAIGNFGAKHAGSISLVTSALSALALTLKDSSSAGVEWSKTLSGGLNTVVGAVLGFASGQWQYAIPMLISGIPTLIDGLIYTTEEKLKNATEKATELSNEALQKKSDYKNLKNEISELEKLTSARYDSKEAMEEYLSYSNQMADKYPELIDYIDSEGNAVLDLSDKYNILEQSRLAAAEAAAKSAMAELETSKLNVQNQKEVSYENIASKISSIQQEALIGSMAKTDEIISQNENIIEQAIKTAYGQELTISVEEVEKLTDAFALGTEYLTSELQTFLTKHQLYGINEDGSLYDLLPKIQEELLNIQAGQNSGVVQEGLGDLGVGRAAGVDDGA